jgi:hypothetical protein
VPGAASFDKPVLLMATGANATVFDIREGVFTAIGEMAQPVKLPRRLARARQGQGRSHPVTVPDHRVGESLSAMKDGNPSRLRVVGGTETEQQPEAAPAINAPAKVKKPRAKRSPMKDQLTPWHCAENGSGSADGMSRSELGTTQAQTGRWRSDAPGYFNALSIRQMAVTSMCTT